MAEIDEGDPIKYIGAFYPQEQDEYNYSSWKGCAYDLNVVLASHINFSEQTFVDQVIKGDENRWESRWALCWDACYAYLKTEPEAFNRAGATALLKDAMVCVKKSINSMSLNPTEKQQYWCAINWGAFVADEPINNAADEDQNSDDAIDDKCKAVQDALDQASEETEGDTLPVWPSHTIRKMVVLHRMGDDSETGQFPGNEEVDDSDFQSIAGDWCDGAAKYRVNLWGIDPYVSHNGDFSIVDEDRDWLFDAVVYELGAATEDSHFMVMVGKAFRNTDPSEQWLDEDEYQYYYDHINGWSSTYGVYWEDQFLALFWWAYCTAAIEGDLGEPEGYEDDSDTAEWIGDMSNENFTEE